ncbi:hypothetical protein [Treponema pedis]|uniref:hypothetical protein n=1 Tax=Treponema pedis TaxID=409322 RepID=UPI00040F568D|nr:hypothetical protein [Treponema pedis]
MNKIKLSILPGLLIVFFSLSCKTLQKKDDPNFLGDFSPKTIAKVMAGTVKRTKNEIKPAEFTFVFSPRSNTVMLHHKFLGDNIWVTLTEKNRKVIIEGMNLYIEEYKNKNIDAANNKKKAYYGKTPIELSWGVLGAGRFGKAELRCEFQLITNNRPYFILGNATQTNKEGANCPAMRMAFSPAQCADIIEILKQENLNKLVAELQKEFGKYELDEEGNFKDDIEKSAKESSEEDTVNYDSDF